MQTVTLECTRCKFRSECEVQEPTPIGTVLSTGECDQCSFDEDTGRTAVVVAN